LWYDKFMRRGILSIIIVFISVGISLAEVINPRVVQQGKCFSVSLTSPEAATSVTVSFLGQRVNCYQGDDSFSAIVGVAPEQRPGDHPLILIVTKGDGSREEIKRTIKVGKIRFPFVSFWLKPSKKKLFTKDLIAEEWARIEKVLVVEPAQKAWSGRFNLPAKGPVSMVFGTVERVNGKPSGRHRGLDLAVPMGTRIKAPNHGRVVFAEHLKAFGGTIVLDHGQGIHTLYFHLSKFLAKAGQDVSKGDIIALSGNSGISSGPHLHWGMSAHNLRVDPVQWTKYAF